MNKPFKITGTVMVPHQVEILVEAPDIEAAGKAALVKWAVDPKRYIVGNSDDLASMDKSSFEPSMWAGPVV